MALTTLSSKDGDGKKDKKKKKKEKNKDKKATTPLMGASNFEKPLRGSRRQNSMDNHVDDGYLKHHSNNHHIRHRKRQHEDSDVCFTCLRNALHCYNIVILIMGIGAVAVGVWLLVTDFNAREVSVLFYGNFFEIGTYLILGGGGLIALLAFCGCCGTMREDRCILGFYGVVLCLVFIAFIVGGVLAFMFRDDLSVDFRERFASTIEKEYASDHVARTDSHKRLVTDAWDSLQRKLQCCGAYGNISSHFSWAIYKQHSNWYARSEDKYPLVPESCCREDGNKDLCQGQDFHEGPPRKGPPFKSGHKDNPHLYTVGCYDKAVEYMLQHSMILGAVAFAVPIFLLVGTIISFCLCAKVRKTEDDDEEEL